MKVSNLIMIGCGLLALGIGTMIADDSDCPIEDNVFIALGCLLVILGAMRLLHGHIVAKVRAKPTTLTADSPSRARIAITFASIYGFAIVYGALISGLVYTLCSWCVGTFYMEDLFQWLLTGALIASVVVLLYSVFARLLIKKR